MGYPHVLGPLSATAFPCFRGNLRPSHWNFYGRERDLSLPGDEHKMWQHGTTQKLRLWLRSRGRVKYDNFWGLIFYVFLFEKKG